MLTVGQVARILHVDPKTVSRWCRMGRLAALTTPGGHRRIPLAAVLDLLRGMGMDDQTALNVVRGGKRHVRSDRQIGAARARDQRVTIRR